MLFEHYITVVTSSKMGCVPNLFNRTALAVTRPHLLLERIHGLSHSKPWTKKKCKKKVQEIQLGKTKQLLDFLFLCVQLRVTSLCVYIYICPMLPSEEAAFWWPWYSELMHENAEVKQAIALAKLAWCFFHQHCWTKACHTVALAKLACCFFSMHLLPRVLLFHKSLHPHLRRQYLYFCTKLASVFVLLY